jgi:hypothetical protein
VVIGLMTDRAEKKKAKNPEAVQALFQKFIA